MNNIYKLTNPSNKKCVISSTTLPIYQRIQNIKQIIKKNKDKDNNKYVNLWDKEKQTLEQFLDNIEIELIESVNDKDKKVKLKQHSDSNNSINKNDKIVFKPNSYRYNLLEKAMELLQNLNNDELNTFINMHNNTLNNVDLLSINMLDCPYNYDELLFILDKWRNNPSNKDIIDNTNVFKFIFKRIDNKKIKTKEELLKVILDIQLFNINV